MSDGDDAAESVKGGARRKRAVFLAAGFFGGGIGGTLLDQIHVREGVLRYTHPSLAGQAWWVAPQFGTAVLLILLFANGVTGRRMDRASDPIPVAADAGVFVVAYAVTGILHRHPLLVGVVLVGLWAAMLVAHPDRRMIVVISIVLAITGPIYESLVTWSGAFRYEVTPLILRVPAWLPALYLNAGLLASAVARATRVNDSNLHTANRTGCA